jgi:hypothetical protein
MEFLVFVMAIIFLVYQAYCFMQDGGLSHTTASRLFWMFVSLTIIIISYIIYIHNYEFFLGTKDKEIAAESTLGYDNPKRKIVKRKSTSNSSYSFQREDHSIGKTN